MLGIQHPDQKKLISPRFTHSRGLCASSTGQRPYLAAYTCSSDGTPHNQFPCPILLYCVCPSTQVPSAPPSRSLPRPQIAPPRPNPHWACSTRISTDLRVRHLLALSLSITVEAGLLAYTPLRHSRCPHWQYSYCCCFDRQLPTAAVARYCLIPENRLVERCRSRW